MTRDASGHQGRDATYKWARDREVNLTMDSISQVIHDCETCTTIKQAKRVKPLWFNFILSFRYLLPLSSHRGFEDNKKYFHKYINGKRKSKTKFCSLLDAGGNLVTADEKVEVLNAFFASAFRGKMTCPQDYCPPGLVNSVREQNGPPVIQEEAVRELLCLLDVHKSMGPDGIYPRVMREMSDELLNPLSIIYQQSWLTGEVPDYWKLANVMPIHKKGRKDDPGKYRPVSLTSVPSKVMEQFILSIITQHLQDGQGIRPSQHGFRRGRSCLTNLITYYYQGTHPVDVRNAGVVVYLDFSKAFDTVSHSILQEKLAAHSLDRSTLLG
ncbi:hypothetical protein TURU_012424 [Turdus rufiventris]|nr:hypothetical protein TURU_012424 [Turdus rufiventris]